jgi:hypothetical protein
MWRLSIIYQIWQTRSTKERQRSMNQTQKPLSDVYIRLLIKRRIRFLYISFKVHIFAIINVPLIRQLVAILLSRIYKALGKGSLRVTRFIFSNRRHLTFDNKNGLIYLKHKIYFEAYNSQAVTRDDCLLM